MVSLIPCLARDYVASSFGLVVPRQLAPHSCLLEEIAAFAVCVSCKKLRDLVGVIHGLTLPFGCTSFEMAHWAASYIVNSRLCGKFVLVGRWMEGSHVGLSTKGSVCGIPCPAHLDKWGAHIQLFSLVPIIFPLPGVHRLIVAAGVATLCCGWAPKREEISYKRAFPSYTAYIHPWHSGEECTQRVGCFLFS